MFMRLIGQIVIVADILVFGISWHCICFLTLRVYIYDLAEMQVREVKSYSDSREVENEE